MRNRLLRLLAALSLVAGCMVLVPAVAHADVGSTIVDRFWDSMVNMFKNRLQEGTPTTVSLMQEAEKIFLGETQDVTTMAPIRDAYKAMRVAGLLLLGLCTVISLAALTESSLTGGNSDLMEWVKRFCVATFMTMGSIHFYGLWIRVFNALLTSFRQYLDTHWGGVNNDPSMLLTTLIPMVKTQNIILVLAFATVLILALLILWFLIGGIRFAELALAVIIAPLVWPLYVIPALDDIPKSAFRSFLGLNALLLIVVAMLRLAVRMVVGGGILNTVWNLVPAISLVVLTIFLPSMIKKLVGQGNTGVGGLMTAAYMLAGLKGLTMAAGAVGTGTGAAASPPATGAVPQSPSGPSAYPVAPVPSSGVSGGSRSGSGGSQRPPMEEVWVTAPGQLHGGAATAHPALEAKTGFPASEAVIDLGQSKPGSDDWDTVVAVTQFLHGQKAGAQPNKPEGDDE